MPELVYWKPATRGNQAPVDLTRLTDLTHLTCGGQYPRGSGEQQCDDGQWPPGSDQQQCQYPRGSDQQPCGGAQWPCGGGQWPCGGAQWPCGGAQQPRGGGQQLPD